MNERSYTTLKLAIQYNDARLGKLFFITSCDTHPPTHTHTLHNRTCTTSNTKADEINAIITFNAGQIGKRHCTRNNTFYKFNCLYDGCQHKSIPVANN